MRNEIIGRLIDAALSEDVGDGDHSSLASIPEGSAGSARLIIKAEGILAGIEIAGFIFRRVDPGIDFTPYIEDGSQIGQGDIGFMVTGKQRELLKAERLVLNVMQRMSGIATETKKYVDAIEGTGAKILDTRKTTPGFRFFEKEAVRLGGGLNHRMGLYDMIMLKDNHIDFAGGIREAIAKTATYLKSTGRDLKIEIEARSLADVREIMEVGGVDRIMLDNFSTGDTARAVGMINGRFETESSGGITLDTIRGYAECGVDFISVGALTHHIKSLDMSMKVLKA
ncbi:MAG: carboxylating nicotinate-nucleotide diphosphorylase [Bacteroidales bacterium]